MEPALRRPVFYEFQRTYISSVPGNHGTNDLAGWSFPAECFVEYRLDFKNRIMLFVVLIRDSPLILNFNATRRLAWRV
jgi:hypothetical protein